MIDLSRDFKRTCEMGIVQLDSVQHGLHLQIKKTYFKALSCCREERADMILRSTFRHMAFEYSSGVYPRGTCIAQKEGRTSRRVNLLAN